MLTHKGTQDIYTERLLLRRYRAQDTADIYKNYAADSRVTQYLPWEAYTDVADLQAFVDEQVSAYADDVYNWVIVYGGEVVGGISAYHIDEGNASCEIGYCLGHAHWGGGVITEAVKAMIGYLIGEVGFHRIYAKHDADNAASGRVMQKCGLTCEGRLRDYYLREDARSDAVIYSILSHEYSAK